MLCVSCSSQEAMVVPRSLKISLLMKHCLDNKHDKTKGKEQGTSMDKVKLLHVFLVKMLTFNASMIINNSAE